jgi:hypothetical protein
VFAGSDGGAEHWAVIASLVETCKLNGVEPLRSVADVIAWMVEDHPQSRSSTACRGIRPANEEHRMTAPSAPDAWIPAKVDRWQLSPRAFRVFRWR